MAWAYIIVVFFAQRTCRPNSRSDKPKSCAFYWNVPLSVVIIDAKKVTLQKASHLKTKIKDGRHQPPDWLTNCFCILASNGPILISARNGPERGRP